MNEQIDKKTAKSLPLEGAETPDGVASPHPSRFAARHPGEGFWQPAYVIPSEGQRDANR